MVDTPCAEALPDGLIRDALQRYPVREGVMPRQRHVMDGEAGRFGGKFAAFVTCCRRLQPNVRRLGRQLGFQRLLTLLLQDKRFITRCGAGTR